jgi:phosphomannomutase
MMKNLMIGVSGVRGRIDRDFTPPVAASFSLAFGRFVGGGRVVVGRDTRPSGEIFRHALLTGLLYSGCEVFDIGICPTPTVLFGVREKGAAGGVAITASHNPPEWNAFKFIGPDAVFLDAEGMERIREGVERPPDPPVGGLRPGSVIRYPEGIDRHIEAILGIDLLNVDAIQRSRFRVVIDGCNGAGAALTPRLLKRLGCEVIPLFCELDGHFPRNPEPLAEHLGALADRVREAKADVGMAHDPDADRLSLVDETGRPLGEEMTLALAVRLVLSKKRGPIATNLSTSRMVDDIAGEYGVEVHRTPVGEINVARRLEEIGGVVGGEGNGGVILPALHFTRDAPLAAALILQSMVERGPLSSLASSISNYVMIKGKVEPASGLRVDLERIRKAAGGAVMDEQDGLKLTWDREWVHIRKSGTEPIVRIIVEAEDRSRAEALFAEYRDRVVGGEPA